MRVAQVLRLAAPALLLSSLVLLPFLNKAFTIDDPVFLFEAQHALTDPLHPTAFEMTWYANPERLSAIVPTGPLMAWLLAPSVLAGGAEWLAHAIQLAMFWIAIAATVSLSLKLGLSPTCAVASGLLLSSMPAVLAMTGTAMPDTPAMALGVAGLDRLVAWRDDQRRCDGVMAAILLGAAPLARSHLVLLLGVGALFTVGDLFSAAAWLRGAWMRWLPLAGALVITAGISAATQDPSPKALTVAGIALRLASLEMLPSNTVAFAAHWVLALAFALPWFVLRWRALLARFWVVVLTTGVAAILLREFHGEMAPYFIAPIAGLGAAAVADAIAVALRHHDAVGLTLAAWLLLPLSTVVYVHLPPKYLLASAPAAAILIARRVSQHPRLGKVVVAVTVAAGVAGGIAILRADEAFAGAARAATELLIRPRVLAGKSVWYAGHWGFQWYAERAGARCLSATPPFPRVGDIIVSSAASNPFIDVWSNSNLGHLGTWADIHPGGRIMSRDAGAGFYSNDWGYLPWSWGSEPVDTFDAWIVNPPP